MFDSFANNMLYFLFRKECIMNVSMFDFLKDVVANVPDMQNEEEPSSSTVVASQEPATKKATRKR